MFNMVSNINNLFKSLSEPKTVTVKAHSKEKEWGLPLVRLGQGNGERDIYDMSQTINEEPLIERIIDSFYKAVSTKDSAMYGKKEKS